MGEEMTMQVKSRRPANGLSRFLRDERATTAIEYALIASVVSMAILGTVNTIGSALIENFYNKITAAFDEVAAD